MGGHSGQRPVPPKGAQMPPRRRPPPKQAKPDISPSAQLLGYAVLGVGALTFLTVLIMAFTGGVDTGGPALDPKVAQSLQDDIAATGTGAQGASPATSAAQPAPKLALARQKSVKIGDIAGGWQASIGDYIAVMEMKNGAFQIILAHGDQSHARLYSAGTYEMLDDIVILRPRKDWKAPAVPPGSGIRYERLTAGRYPMIVGFQRGAMIWQNVPPGERRIYVPPRSPLLLSGDQDYIVWKKI